MQIGIVGLPNVGKSTLFNALTKSASAEAANYPFCTIDPNVGIVEVPDERITALAKIVNPERTMPAVTEFVDIAGLVKGASEGEGLGNKFLSHIRECDAVAQVIRVFESGDITHVHESVDPKRDREVIETELILADLQTIEKRIRAVEKELKTQKKEIKESYELYVQLKESLEKGNMVYNFDYEDEHGYLKECHLLTSKPFLYIANVSEDELNGFDEKAYKAKLGLKDNDSLVPVCAKLEEDLAELSDEEANEFLDELGIQNSGRSALIKKAYETLGLETYFTAGEQEVRAWTYKKEMSAPECAGVIHTDFEKGFICGDIVNWKDFVEAGGWAGAKDKGLVKMQGRDYIMQDGDVCFFKFSN